MISGLCCEVDENCALLGYYAVSSGNSLPTFHDSLSVPSSKVKNAETSVRNYHYSLHNNPKEQFSNANQSGTGGEQIKTESFTF